ncbi:hypothetical protein MHYP_G00169950 [Metynnis hypsauchen]
MEFSSFLLLLLVALSVQEGLCKEPYEASSPDADDEKRLSLYHNYSIHNNNWIMKDTVQFDGVEVYSFVVKITGAWKYSPWEIGLMDVNDTFCNHYKKLYHRVKDVLSKETDSDFTLRYGCEAERSSSGAVTLLTTTAEIRFSGKIVLRFNVDRDQWEALDERASPFYKHLSP